MANECRYCKKLHTKGYIRCERDGSIRKYNNCGLGCPKFKKKLLDRFLDWLFK